jgi:hypothetical protein
MAQAAAGEAGLEMVFWGPTPMRRGCGAADLDRWRIPRMSLDWYERLPGRDRVPLRMLLARKMGERFRGPAQSALCCKAATVRERSAAGSEDRSLTVAAPLEGTGEFLRNPTGRREYP